MTFRFPVCVLLRFFSPPLIVFSSKPLIEQVCCIIKRLTRLNGDYVAVQKSKKTRSRRGMRRAHDRLSGPTLSMDPTTGLSHRRHHVAADGYYRGQPLIQIRQEETEDEEQEEH